MTWAANIYRAPTDLYFRRSIPPKQGGSFNQNKGPHLGFQVCQLLAAPEAQAQHGHYLMDGSKAHRIQLANWIQLAQCWGADLLVIYLPSFLTAENPHEKEAASLKKGKFHLPIIHFQRDQLAASFREGIPFGKMPQRMPQLDAHTKWSSKYRMTGELLVTTEWQCCMLGSASLMLGQTLKKHVPKGWCKIVIDHGRISKKHAHTKKKQIQE